MKRLVLLAVAACAASLVVGLSNAGAGPATVVCTDAFSGTAFNVVVPDDNFCVLSGATITHDLLIGADAGAGAGVFSGEPGLTVGHDVTMQHDSEVDFGATVIGHDLIGTTNDGFHLERTTIRGDLLAFQPATVQTGGVDPDSPGGPVHIRGDLVIQGAPPDNDFVFDDLFLLTVDREVATTTSLFAHSPSRAPRHAPAVVTASAGTPKHTRDVTSGCRSGRRPCRWRNGVRQVARGSGARCQGANACRRPPGRGRGTGGTRPPTPHRSPATQARDHRSSRQRPLSLSSAEPFQERTLARSGSWRWSPPAESWSRRSCRLLARSPRSPGRRAAGERGRAGSPRTPSSRTSDARRDGCRPTARGHSRTRAPLRPAPPSRTCPPRPRRSRPATRSSCRSASPWHASLTRPTCTSRGSHPSS